MNIQGWFPLGLAALIFLLSKGLSKVFSNTIVQKHQFFGAQTVAKNFTFVSQESQKQRRKLRGGRWKYPKKIAENILNFAEDIDSRIKGIPIHGSGRSPGGGHGNPCQCSCLENPMDRGAWWAAVHRVTELGVTEHACKQNTLDHIRRNWIQGETIFERSSKTKKDTKQQNYEVLLLSHYSRVRLCATP